ncbi:MAG: hypothetical protein EA377_03015 [Phycisphaerales bacterium]|nr:MAG: hypothetical protein EA377_03015 [Phycisphaerales bacterium]
MLDVLMLTLANATAAAPETIWPEDNPWGEDEGMVYILLGVGLILTIALMGFFLFIFMREDPAAIKDEDQKKPSEQKNT